MVRPNCDQLEALADFLAKNPGIAKGLLRSAHGKSETKKKWHEASFYINALGEAQRDGRGWAKFWADKKCALIKKICAQKAQLLRGAGSGAGEEILSPIDQLLMGAMGGPQFAVKDTHVTVSPYTPESRLLLKKEKRQHSVDLEDTPRRATWGDKSNEDRQRSRLQRTPSRSQRRRPRSASSSSEEDSDRFSNVKKKRDESETATAMALSHAVEKISNLTAAIDTLSNTTREAAQSITDALKEIAVAFKNKPAECMDHDSAIFD